MTTKKLCVLACGALIAPAVAVAEDTETDLWSDSRMQSEIGVSTILGGGVTGFTDETVRDTLTSDIAGLWNLRVTLGSHTPIGFDVGYVGTAADINALTGTQSGTLVGTSLEGALRFNVLPKGEWNPYAFVGMGWQRYDIRGANFSLSDTGMNDSDDSIVYPMGLGVSFRDTSGVVIDLKGTFRPVSNQDLIIDPALSGEYAQMHSWEASAAAGYEF